MTGTNPSYVNPTQYSRQLRERLNPCLECNSMNTRINIRGNKVKCFDCGITSVFVEKVIDREAMWNDLLKLEEKEL